MNPVLLTLLLQSAVTLVLALAGGLAFDRIAAYSALAGGAAAVLPNSFLAARMLAPSLRNDATRMLRAAWVGEIGKILLTFVIFAAVFVTVKPLSGPALIGTFIATQMVTLAVLLVDGRRGEQAT